MSDHDQFFGTGFFDWQRGGGTHYQRLYEQTAYDEDRYWGGFSREPLDEATNELPEWAIGPFEKFTGNPVLAPAPGGWDRGRFGGGVHNGAILRRDGVFHYLYRGEQPLPVDFWAGTAPGDTDMQEIDYICDIGLATSTNGITFERSADTSPFFRVGADAGYSFEDVCAVEHEDRYYMFCNRWDWKDHDNPARNGVFVAVSDDLRTWRKVGLVFPDATEIHRNACVLQDPHNRAVRVDGRFVMYLNNGLVAYSEDLLHWSSTKVEQLWPGGEGCFALTDHSTTDPDQIVLFTGGHHTGHFYAVGEVLLSKADPERALDWAPRPVLVAEEKYPWENARSADDPNRVVSPFRETIFFTGMTLHRGQWWMYYGGSEVYTCLATADAAVPSRPAEANQPPP
jgi:predicted GH43/DUF377 family glycosyl hydrolase